ncbi:class I tRNA ligase family protein, partial [Mycetocola reblochoni]
KTIDSGAGAGDGAVREAAEALALLLDLYAPFTAADMWAKLGHDDPVALVRWPEAEPALLVEDTVVAVVQVNGKLRDRLQVSPSIGADELRALALASEAVTRAVGDAEIAAVIVREPKLVNIAIKR